MQAVEIQDHARKLFEAHGPRAIAEATQKAKSLEAQGQKDEADDWRRIVKALGHLAGPRST